MFFVLKQEAAFAQNVSWIATEHYQNAESFKQILRVESNTAPFIVAYMNYITPIAGGGSGGDEYHYIYYYDTSGVELFHYQSTTKPLKMISNSEDSFWMITYGLDSLETRNGYVYSPYNGMNDLYFIEFNRDGDVLNSFVFGFNPDINMLVSDVILDRNNEFCLLGNLTPEGLVSEDFIFSGDTMSLDPQLKTFFLAKFGINGSEIGLTTFESKRFSPVKTGVTCFDQNKEDGSYLVAGFLNDTVKIDGQPVLEIQDGIRDLILIEFDEQLNHVQNNVYKSSTQGCIPEKMVYNETNGFFYLAGKLGGELYLLDSLNPNPGHPTSPLGTTFIAKVSGTSILDGKYMIPQDFSSNFRGVIFGDFDLNQQGNIRMAVNIYDYTFLFGDSLLTVNNTNLDYEIANMDIDPGNLALNSVELTNDDNTDVCMCKAVDFDTQTGCFYLAGTFQNILNYNYATANSFLGYNDGFIIKLVYPDNNNVSVDFELDADRIKVYPNPVTDHVTIELKGGEDILIRIYDQQGKVIFSGSGNQKINMEALKKGMYLIEAITSSGSMLKKIIKQ